MLIKNNRKWKKVSLKSHLFPFFFYLFKNNYYICARCIYMQCSFLVTDCIELILLWGGVLRS